MHCIYNVVVVVVVVERNFNSIQKKIDRNTVTTVEYNLVQSAIKVTLADYEHKVI